jgi:hypothetical protein
MNEPQQLIGKLVVAGTMMVSNEELTGLFIQMPIDDLRKVKWLPMYKQVIVTVAEPSSTCPKCNGVGRHVRVRYFEDEDADVWECQSPLCTSFGLLWHTSRPKSQRNTANA